MQAAQACVAGRREGIPVKKIETGFVFGAK
jgi:hypothetical protein